jgi:hypothetical protein
VWLAVSRARIYAFAARDDRVGDLVGVWNRGETTVDKGEALTATTLWLRVGASGPQLRVAAPRFRSGKRGLVRLLVDPTRDA